MQLSQYCLTALTLSVICHFALSGCTVGPNFQMPKAPPITRYTIKPLPKHTAQSKERGQAGESQTFTENLDVPQKWWQAFHSEKLNQLIDRGFMYNANLAAMDAAIRIAKENLRAQIGISYFPSIDSNSSVLRARVLGGNGATGNSPAVTTASASSFLFNQYTTSLNLNYNLDLIGGTRRQVEAMRAKVDFAQYQYQATYITLAANIVTTVISRATREAQIKATHDLIQAAVKQLHIMQKQLMLGAINQESLLAQETLVNQTKASLPPLETSLAQTEHTLSTLVGAYPNESLPSISLNELVLPKQLPVSLPSRLVEQRPDVLAASAQLHVASAGIGVATANLLPQFNLSAGLGAQAIATHLLHASSKIWDGMLAASQPIFHGGALFAERRSAIATFEQSREQYRQTVLQALQNVADVLAALQSDAKALRDQARAEQSAKNNWQLTQGQYRLGGVNYLYVLNAEQQYQNARLLRIQAEAARYNDTTALFLALGGGWWHKEES